MRVSSEKPFEIVYALFNHEYLGILFESFAVQLDEKGNYSLAYQNISSKNAAEFSAGLDTLDYELIKLMDNMQQETIVKKFNTKNAKPKEFLRKVYEEQASNASFIEIQKQLEHRLENMRSKILAKLSGRRLFEMGNDGNPVWKEINIMPKRASVLFHFRRNEENTHYFPTIKYDGEKLDWQYKGAYLVCKEPAWLVEVLRLVGQSILLLVIVALGVLFDARLLGDRRVIVALALRVLLGLALGLLLAWIFDLQGLTRAVLVLGAAAPIGFSAVVFADREGLHREMAASAASISVRVNWHGNARPARASFRIASR